MKNQNNISSLQQIFVADEPLLERISLLDEHLEYVAERVDSLRDDFKSAKGFQESVLDGTWCKIKEVEFNSQILILNACAWLLLVLGLTVLSGVL